jgi:hypothetical protein
MRAAMHHEAKCGNIHRPLAAQGFDEANNASLLLDTYEKEMLKDGVIPAVRVSLHGPAC